MAGSTCLTFGIFSKTLLAFLGDAAIELVSGECAYWQCGMGRWRRLFGLKGCRSWARQSSGGLGNSPEVWRHRLRSWSRQSSGVWRSAFGCGDQRFDFFDLFVGDAVALVFSLDYVQ